MNLILGLLVDVELRKIEEARRPKPPSTRPPSKAPPPPPRERQKAVVPPPAPVVRWLVEGLGGLSGGRGPSPTATMQVAVEWRPGPLALRLDLDGGLPTEAPVATATAAFTPLSAGLALCPRLPAAPSLELAACLGQRFDALLVSVSGLPEADQAPRFLSRTELSAAVRLDVTDAVFSVVRGATWMTVVRPRYLVQEGNGDSAGVHHPALVGASLGLGVGARF